MRQYLRLPPVICLLLALLATVTMFALGWLGFLQELELRTFDQMLLQRTSQPIDPRIVVIGETEADIRRFGHPLSDQVLANAIDALEKAEARVIGIDKYRDVAVPPGSEQLTKALQDNGNIVWIFFGGNTPQEYISAPQQLTNNPERIGFNDVVEDPDGVARRGLLFLEIDGTSYYAFPLLLSLHYLAAENIAASSDAAGFLSLNGISLPNLSSHFGAYNTIDSGGYQISLDYPGIPQSFSSYTLSELLDGTIDKSSLRDKIVLIGGTAPSLHDYRLLPNEQRRFGVEHHAYFVSQLLNTALHARQPLRDWSQQQEAIWLFSWCLIGAFSGWKRGSLVRLTLIIAAECGLLIFITNRLFDQGYWLPLVGPLFGWLGAIGSSILFFSSQERAERRQLMQLFAKHVSPQVANRLWQSREQFFSEGGVRPDTLIATVLFTDLANFTTIAESMEPLALMKWLNRYMEEMSKIVIEHGGMINKYIGDAIMAVFGAPVKSESEAAIADDAQRAVECALRFNQRLLELNREWKEQGLPTLMMRVGIHTGTVVAGSFGGSLRMEYTVIGDTVNTASRLESFDKTIAPPTAAQPCRILIGETTQHHLVDRHPSQPVGECQLKGKNKRLTIYQVIP